MGRVPESGIGAPLRVLDGQFFIESSQND